jgi:cell division septal protein FtsQ
VAGLLGATALAALTGYLWLSGSYRIESATLSGNTRIPAHTVFAAAGVHGKRIFTVDTAAAAERIEALPDVDQAKVTVRFPSSVHIEVIETAPVLLWHCNSGTWAVDGVGRVVSVPPDSRGLPIISDQSDSVAGPGDQIEPAVLDAGRSYSARYGQLIYKQEIGFVATSPEGWEVRLGRDASRDARQAAILESLRSSLAEMSGRVAMVDLRFDGRPYYRLKSQGD